MGKVIVIEGDWDNLSTPGYSTVEHVALGIERMCAALPVEVKATVKDEDAEHTHFEELGEGHAIQVNVTGEGIILDAFSDGEPNGTHAWMFGELYDVVQEAEAKRWGR